MSVINEKVVKSKYRALQTILSKKIDFNNIKVKNVMNFKGKIKDIKYKSTAEYVEVLIRYEIYLAYYVEENNEEVCYTSVIEDMAILRFYRINFRPFPYQKDFKDGRFEIDIRNLKYTSDIDMSCRIMYLEISANLIVYLVKERSIEVEEKSLAFMYSQDMSQVALSCDTPQRDVKNYLCNLDDISKLAIKKIDDLENENSYLKDELYKKELEVKKMMDDYLDYKKRVDALSQECTRLTERIKEFEDKYIKEQRRANLLEKENSRNLDEIKRLKKEIQEIVNEIEKKKPSLKEKIKDILKKEI